jgi:hypothetical protein
VLWADFMAGFLVGLVVSLGWALLVQSDIEDEEER